MPVQWIGMKARVFVSFKSTVLDPQGQTIRNALNGLGHKSIADVRQGKFFDVEIAAGAQRAEVEREMNQIAQDVLANPVIEDYRVEFLE
jgi:phosphoribosylformylglycinamidine synthase PurS subunit